ncbi:uracil-xanthine permease family protein [Rothia kristinae]|uniref:uracil-xanthine permease family protein n=1 Tax=Rothia kristinae TaxID=37923 RepID=UPI0021A43302|nr:solute carrier family 23 protein [Rothia kristinae]MCT1356851.1 NCS2 family nucleobase:cation symporter [Rothia kristinae]MCT1392604.1 NCS2 family nucleobase:cation symporter [Rothia kristinae]MCT1506154.1 NCS2 family nucleobase:cation symporter [Rothia kristinae]MCT2037673.1 NCS2 family nucleobase:cation symporter [Rothia kristinae]MCT2243759.1 NCS2 family nucleobase:cation symporter [Rothia kristinae]
MSTAPRPSSSGRPAAARRLGLGWTLHGDGRTVAPGQVVGPRERLRWGRTVSIGAQHVVAMFGATFLVPLITGFPPATTLFFSGLGTILFLLLTAGRVPSYLGSSFAFIAPIGAASNQYGPGGALGGVVMAGAALFVVGLIVQWAGTDWLQKLMPPLVTGAIVALIGFNLAPSAKDNFMKAPVTALVTLGSIILISVLFRGMIGRLSILLGVAIGYVTAVVRREVDFSAIRATWEAEGLIGLPHFQTPEFHLSLAGLFIPVILVLVAENIGHVKSVALMTGENLDRYAGRAIMADGLATTIAGSGGGSGTTTYAENIGVMAATKVYSTAAYWVAAVVALLLSVFPVFGAAVATVPAGVLGGAATVLYGMIGMLGVRIWVQNRVDFSDQVNLTTAAVALIVGIADYTWEIGGLQFAGIALGTGVTLVVYHLMSAIARARRTAQPQPREEHPE